MTLKNLLEKHNIRHGLENDQANIDAFKRELKRVISKQFIIQEIPEIDMFDHDAPSNINARANNKERNLYIKRLNRFFEVKK